MCTGEVLNDGNGRGVKYRIVEDYGKLIDIYVDYITSITYDGDTRQAVVTFEDGRTLTVREKDYRPLMAAWRGTANEIKPATSDFWMVWNGMSSEVTYRHPNRDSAMKEAQRLAENNQGVQFFVLHATDRIEYKGATITKLA